MIVQKDEIASYIPEKPRIIFLGTMCALNARTINGIKPPDDFFYYNDNRNHFWKILQYLFEFDKEPIKLSIIEKKKFLKQHNIGIQNLVSEIHTPKNSKLDPSDTVLFDCYKKNKITFKKLSLKNRKIVSKTPLVFTCRSKKGILELLEGFCETNLIDRNIINDIYFLKTPTRCNPFNRSQEWKTELKQIF